MSRFVRVESSRTLLLHLFSRPDASPNERELIASFPSFFRLRLRVRVRSRTATTPSSLKPKATSSLEPSASCLSPEDRLEDFGCQRRTVLRSLRWMLIARCVRSFVPASSSPSLAFSSFPVSSFPKSSSSFFFSSFGVMVQSLPSPTTTTST